MAEENHIIQPTSSDDTAVLRVLLHTIKGISAVSSPDPLAILAEED